MFMISRKSDLMQKSTKKMFNCLAVFVLSVSFISGCTTLYDSIPSSSANVTPPSSPPKIIFGQKAYIWDVYEQRGVDSGTAPGDEETETYISAWKNTGLFSSVSKATSGAPTSDGVFIIRRCHTYNNFDGDEYPVSPSGIIGFVTLGIVPRTRDIDHFCMQEFYQNGALVTPKHSYDQSLTLYTEFQMKGWASLFKNRKEVYQKSAKTCVNNFLNHMAKD
jgi:hypothetical protein